MNDQSAQSKLLKKRGVHRSVGLFFAVIVVLSASWFVFQSLKASDTRKIIVLVEDRLALPLKDSIAQYELDLRKEDYEVIVRTDVGAAAPPSMIKSILQSEYKGGDLVGVVLVGGFVAPLYNDKGSQGDPYWHDYLNDFYYMDLDGVWEDSDRNGIYDHHRGFRINLMDRAMKKVRHFFPESDRRDPEIWVSRLRADTLSSLGDEIELLKSYFKKNHDYRTGTMPLPPRRAFVVGATVKVLKSDWGARPMELYSDISTVQCQNDISAILRKFLSSTDGYEWGVINAFSGPRLHHFDYREGSQFDASLWESKEGRMQIAKYSDEIHLPHDVTFLDIKTIQPKVLFYHLLTSEVGRHNYGNYLSGAYVFSGSGLAAVAGTQHSGAVGEPIFYQSLAAGKSIGEAWKEGLAWSIKHLGERSTIHWCHRDEAQTTVSAPYKAVLIGDGTLRLPDMRR